MATSNSKLSSNDSRCQQSSMNPDGTALVSQFELRSTREPHPNYEPEHGESCIPELKPEWLQSKDAIKRKRVNRTAKLKQCKLDARREQWLSQGSHNRAKHLDEDCHDTLARKGNDKRHQVSPADPDYAVNIQTPEREQVIHMAENGGNVLPRSTANSIYADNETQRTTIKWRDREINILKLSKLDCAKYSVNEEAYRSTVDEQNDVVINVRKNSQKGTSDKLVSNCHEGYITITSKSSDTTTGNEKGISLTDGSRRREAYGRNGDEMPSDNMQNQGPGSQHLSLAQRHVSNTQLSNICASSRRAGGFSDDNEHSHPHDGEDDWEAVADAIHMQGATSKPEDTTHLGNCGSAELLEREGQIMASIELRNGALQPEYKYKAGLGGRSKTMGGRAWRPDDTARPPTLPRLSKQRSFPLLSTPPAWTGLHDNNLWGPPSAPLSCPICTEELDPTDSSFVPCSCGFRLCLFCHHRIAADDGRCPGCRKAYNSDVALKLSRASSLWLQI